MKLSGVITTRVRTLLDDPASEYWTDPQLITWWNDYVRILFKMRAESQLDTNEEPITYTEATSIGQDIICDDQWVPAGVHYVCSLAFSMNAGGRRDLERSQHHWGLFTEHVKL